MNPYLRIQTISRNDDDPTYANIWRSKMNHTPRGGNWKTSLASLHAKEGPTGTTVAGTGLLGNFSLLRRWSTHLLRLQPPTHLLFAGISQFDDNISHGALL